MASHDVGIGDFVLLDEITVERVVENLKTRCVPSAPSECRNIGRFGIPKLAESRTRFVTGRRRGAPPRARGSRFAAASARGRGLRVGRWSSRNSEGFTFTFLHSANFNSNRTENYTLENFERLRCKILSIFLFRKNSCRRNIY